MNHKYKPFLKSVCGLFLLLFFLVGSQTSVFAQKKRFRNNSRSMQNSGWVMDLVYIIMSKDSTDDKMKAVMALRQNEGDYGLWILNAMKLIAKNGSIKKATIKKITKLTKDKSWQARKFACWALAAVVEGGGNVNKRNLQDIIELLPDRQYVVKEAAAQALISYARSKKTFAPKLIDEIVNRVIKGNWSTRLFAGKVLGAIARSGHFVPGFAIQKLIKLMDYKNYNDKHIALKALYAIAEGGHKFSRSAVESITRQLKNKRPNIRKDAVLVLGKSARNLDYFPRVAISGIVSRLTDNSFVVRNACVLAIKSVVQSRHKLPGSAIGMIVKLLNHSNNWIRHAALQAYLIINTGGNDDLSKAEQEKQLDKMRQLIKFMSSDSQIISDAAVDILVSLADKKKIRLKKLILDLAKSLDHYDSWQRADAGKALGMITLGGQKLNKKIIAKLIDLLKDKDKDVRDSASFALMRAGEIKQPISEDGLAELLSLLADSWAKSSACLALGRISAGGTTIPKDSIAKITALLNDNDWRVRRDACWALGDIVQGGGLIPKESLEGIIKTLADKSRFTRRAACWSLANITKSGLPLPDEAVEGIIILLDDEDWLVRRDASWVLANIAESGKILPSMAIVNIIQLLRDQNFYVRWVACQSLANIAEAGQPLPASAIQQIISLLNDRRKDMQNAVRSALGKIVQTGQIFPNSAINSLIRLIAYNSQSVKRASREVLRNIVLSGQPLPNLAVNRIIQLLSDSNYQVRGAAYKLLGDIVSAGQHVNAQSIKNIINMVQSESAQHRSTACIALGRIAKAGQLIVHSDPHLLEIIKISLENVKNINDILPLIENYLLQHGKELQALINVLNQTAFQKKEDLIQLISMIHNKKSTPEGFERTIFHKSKDISFRRYSHLRLLNSQIQKISSHLKIAIQLESNSYVKVPVVREIGRLKLSEFRSIVTHFLKDQSPYVRMYAAAISGKLGDEKAVPILKKLFVDPAGTPNIKTWSAVSLILLGESKKSYYNYIIGALKARGPRYKHPDELEYINNGYSRDISYKTTVRRTAVVALGDLGDNKLLPYLIKLINDESYYEEHAEENYRYLATSLRNLGIRAVRAVAKMLDTPASMSDIEKVRMRRSALKMLFNIGNSKAIDLIKPHFAKMTPGVKLYAELIISRLKNRKPGISQGKSLFSGLKIKQLERQVY